MPDFFRDKYTFLKVMSRVILGIYGLRTAFDLRYPGSIEVLTSFRHLYIHTHYHLSQLTSDGQTGGM